MARIWADEYYANYAAYCATITDRKGRSAKPTTFRIYEETVDEIPYILNGGLVSIAIQQKGGH